MCSGSRVGPTIIGSSWQSLCLLITAWAIGKEMWAVHKLPFFYIAFNKLVLLQLFAENTCGVDITQILATDDEHLLGAPAKKRRLESGWSSLRDKLDSHQSGTQMVLW